MSKIHHYFHKGLYLNILILKKIVQKLLEKNKFPLMMFQRCYLLIKEQRENILQNWENLIFLNQEEKERIHSTFLRSNNHLPVLFRYYSGTIPVPYRFSFGTLFCNWKRNQIWFNEFIDNLVLFHSISYITFIRKLYKSLSYYLSAIWYLNLFPWQLKSPS